MPKISVQVAKRVRIDCDYDDYKEWESMVSKHFVLTEETVKTQGEYWKSFTFRIGETTYKIAGPIMPLEAGSFLEPTPAEKRGGK